MGAYCSWEEYQQIGGTLNQETFDAWAAQASGLIDRLTMGRARPLLVLFPDPLTGQLASACAQITDLLQANSTALRRAASGITGAAATDGYSETYSGGGSGGALASQSALRGACREILASALGADPYGLLYQGVGCEAERVQWTI